MVKAFCVSRGRWSEKLTQVMSLESVLVGPENYEFENEIMGV